MYWINNNKKLELDDGGTNTKIMTLENAASTLVVVVVVVVVVYNIIAAIIIRSRLIIMLFRCYCKIQRIPIHINMVC